jgi:hypothetical protein
LSPERDHSKSKPTSTLALISKVCPNCSSDLNFLENPSIKVPDDLGELEWDYIKNLSLVPKVLAICVRCGFVAVECLTPAEARGKYLET